MRGARWVPYHGFWKGYKQIDLRDDELIRAIRLPRNGRFSKHFYRKVGTRRAQAISKVCVAALGRLRGGVMEDVRIALGSVAPVPLRLMEVERILRGKRVEPELVIQARRMVAAAIQPIDDIRSTATYRSAVASNLVAEFLEQLRDSGNTA